MYIYMCMVLCNKNESSPYPTYKSRLTYKFPRSVQHLFIYIYGPPLAGLGRQEHPRRTNHPIGPVWVLELWAPMR